MKKVNELPYNYGVKMRIFPSSIQKRVIDKNIDFSRFYWNQLVAANKEIAFLRHNESLVWPWVDARIARLREIANPNCKLLKQMFPFANDNDIDKTSLMQVKANYVSALKLCKKVPSTKPPTFHKKHAFGSYQSSTKYDKHKHERATIFNSENIRFLDSKHVQLTKIGRIHVGLSQKRYLRLKELCDNGFELRISKATISRDSCGDYYVAFQIASDTLIEGGFSKTGSRLGIDLNLENFLTDSNGNVVENPRYYRQARTQLAKAQRKLGKRCARARKEKRPLRKAKNYQKQRKLVAKIQRRVLRRRQAFLDELSTTLIKNHDLVAAEELRSKNLLKNHALSMSIADVGWRIFLTMLEYKAIIHGKEFRTVDPRNTTQTCSCCGHVLKGKHKLTLKDREWTCPKCGQYHNSRDHNAAKNILAKALA